LIRDQGDLTPFIAYPQKAPGPAHESPHERRRLEWAVRDTQSVPTKRSHPGGEKPLVFCSTVGLCVFPVLDGLLRRRCGRCALPEPPAGAAIWSPRHSCGVFSAAVAAGELARSWVNIRAARSLTGLLPVLTAAKPCPAPLRAPDGAGQDKVLHWPSALVADFLLHTPRTS
jgi:hypothetical protein